MSQEILESSPLYQLWYREATEKAAAQAEPQATRNATRIAPQGRFSPPWPKPSRAPTSPHSSACWRMWEPTHWSKCGNGSAPDVACRGSCGE